MSDAPKPQFVAYPRPDSVAEYGTAEKLEALGQAYFAMSYVFAVNVVLVIACRVMIAAFSWVGFFAGMIVMSVGISALSLTPNRKIAFGKGWPDSKAMLASVLIGLNSALCCGVIGFMVMQAIAAKEIRRYGVNAGAFGIRKKDIAAAVRRRREAQTLTLAELE